MRMRFNFWLDLEKKDENSLVETINILKEKRDFVRTIRNGIRLIYDLSQGRTDVLSELFPWVLESLPRANPPILSSASEPLLQRFDRMEQLLLSHNTPLALPIGRKKDPEPLPEFELTKAKSDENPTYNILLSGVALGIARAEDFSPDILEYGIRKGKLPKSAQKILEEKRAKQPPPGPRPMEVPKLDAPSFDDADLAGLL